MGIAVIKMGVTINFTFEKKHLYFLVLMFGIAVGILVVNAYNTPPTWTTPPSQVGHSVDEMDWSQPIMREVQIGSSAMAHSLNVVGNLNASGNLGVNGWNPNGGYPNGWALSWGVHANDIFAEGSVGAGKDISGNPKVSMNRNGDGYFSRNLNVGGIVTVFNTVNVVGNVEVSGYTRTKGLLYTGQTTSTRMIWGRVWHDGNINLGGSGQWNSYKASLGRYILNFTPCFAATPVFTGNAHSPRWQGIPNEGIIRTVQTNNISTCYADIFTGDGNGARDVPFQFTIIGPNLP